MVTFVIKVGGRFLKNGKLVRRMSHAQIFCTDYGNETYTYGDMDIVLNLGFEAIVVQVETRTTVIVRRKDVVDRRQRQVEHNNELRLTEPTSQRRLK